jgi:hypothetical protein
MLTGADRSQGYARVEFEIYEVLKGRGIEEAENVVIESDGHDCEYPFEKDGIYLVHALESENIGDSGTDAYSTNICSLTVPIEGDVAKNSQVQIADFAVGRELYWHSESFSISYGLSGTDYDVTGRLTSNLKVQDMEIIPGRGITLGFAPSNQSGMIELFVPKDIMDGIVNHVVVTALDKTDTLNMLGLAVNGTHSMIMVQLPEDTHQLEVNGSRVVPEFGSAAYVIVAGLLGALGLTTRNFIPFRPR